MSEQEREYHPAVEGIMETSGQNAGRIRDIDAARDVAQSAWEDDLHGHSEERIKDNVELGNRVRIAMDAVQHSLDGQGFTMLTAHEAVVGSDKSAETARIVEKAKEQGRIAVQSYDDFQADLPEIRAEAANTDSVESKERLGHSGFEVRVDKAMLETSGLSDEMREWLTQLPDTLTFDEPVTLIVGQNGSGKTQFARAILAAVSNNRVGIDARNMDYLLDKGEPAEMIAPALSLVEPPSGNCISGFIEGADVMHGSRQWARQQARDINLGRGESTEHRLSSRELFNQSVKDIMNMRVDSHRGRVFGGSNRFEANPGEVIVVFDEPEQGLSPDGQDRLAQDMVDFLPASDTLMVPTNNYVLARLSDLPRLDLAHPERGIHRPSEYGELYELVKAGSAA
jgi:predicted ATPase